MTNKEKFELIKTYIADNEELIAFCDKNIEALSRKRVSTNSKAKQATAKRAEKVYNAFKEMGEPTTISQMLKLTSDTEVADYSVSRVSALIRNLNKDSERIKKTVEKGKSYFEAC